MGEHLLLTKKDCKMVGVCLLQRDTVWQGLDGDARSGDHFLDTYVKELFRHQDQRLSCHVLIRVEVVNTHTHMHAREYYVGRQPMKVKPCDSYMPVYEIGRAHV